jgi:hypothetical protein
MTNLLDFIIEKIKHMHNRGGKECKNWGEKTVLTLRRGTGNTIGKTTITK